MERKKTSKIVKKHVYKTATLMARTSIRKLFSVKARKTVGNTLRTVLQTKFILRIVKPTLWDIQYLLELFI